MNCIICGEYMHRYFTKTFNKYQLGDVNYSVCDNCGFCASKTHFDMPMSQWTDLNRAFHRDSDAREDNPYNRNQRYFNQALMLHMLRRDGMLARSNWLDWGSGSGPLARQLERHFGVVLQNFDKFMAPKAHSVAQGALVARSYELVVNTAVFEHVRDRETLDEIESYVSGTGCFAIHTLVRGEIPADADWMYLLPVHCAFHTNKSMNILMHQWGYTCSIYNEHAKMWVWFRSNPDAVASQTNQLNQALGWEYLHFKAGFMDYWP